MARIFYEVAAEMTDPSAETPWVRWMLEDHLRDVVEAGAACGRLIQLDVSAGAPGRYLAQYEFEDTAALERYLADQAPRLRAEGLARFSPDRVQLSRRTGRILEAPGGARAADGSVR